MAIDMERFYASISIKYLSYGTYSRILSMVDA